MRNNTEKRNRLSSLLNYHLYSMHTSYTVLSSDTTNYPYSTPHTHELIAGYNLSRWAAGLLAIDWHPYHTVCS